MLGETKYIETMIDKGVYTITLNRSETRNALDHKMLSLINEAVINAEEKDNVRVIVIQSKLDNVFASGADLKKLNKREPLQNLKPGMQKVYENIANSNKVTIALINGYALGGGCELALACDIRIAMKDATLGFPELNLGIIPGAGGTQRLSRMIGIGRALDMILTGKFIDGIEAERIGMVSYVAENNADKSKLLQSLLEKLYKKGPIALQLSKYALVKGYDSPMNVSLWLEKLSQTVAFGTQDKEEGINAFLEKRKAHFQNK